MVKLNVRCCCTSTKILGTLEAPNDIAKKKGSFVILEKHREVVSILTHVVKTKLVGQSFMNKRGDKTVKHEMAVYSQNRSVEFWRNIDNFKEK